MTILYSTQGETWNIYFFVCCKMKSSWLQEKLSWESEKDNCTIFMLKKGKIE